MTSVARRKKPAHTVRSAPAERAGLADIAALGIAIAMALLLMAHNGSKRAVELMPWPDGLEYAAAAVNLDEGRGPVLHFAGYSYPSRYTEGYPLILAAAYRLGGNVERLRYASMALAIIALAALYVLGCQLFDRTSAFVASLILAGSPVFLAYSTLVLSDVAAFAVSLLAALALARASHWERSSESPGRRIFYWLGFAGLAGFAVMIRPTNIAILFGASAALAFARPSQQWASITALAVALAAAVIFALPTVWQLRENHTYLGGWFASGYTYWVPEVYGTFGRTFNARFVLGPTLPRNPYGNLPVYVLALAGLDRLLGDPAAPPFYLYPLAAAVFAAIALTQWGKWSRAAKRIVAFGLAFLGALLFVYVFYLFTDTVFLLPASFVVFLLAGYGAVVANRKLAGAWAVSKRSSGQWWTIAATLLLDVMLVTSILGEAAQRLRLGPRRSKIVPALHNIDARVEPDAIIVSNVSLEFLALYLHPAQRNFAGLHSFDPGEDYSDYHLARLYAKRALGWKGPLPAVLFEMDKLDSATMTSLLREAGKRPTYLLLASPESSEYAHTLSAELDRLRTGLKTEQVLQLEPLTLYRLSGR